MASTQNYNFPQDRFYDRENHMWAKRDEKTGRVLIGIDELGLESLGDLAYISLQAVGIPIRRGESLGTLEAAKMTGDFISPVSGILIGRNEAVITDPTIVNKDPYEKGWMISIDPTDWESESREMVSGDAIPAWVADEAERYKKQGFVD